MTLGKARNIAAQEFVYGLLFSSVSIEYVLSTQEIKFLGYSCRHIVVSEMPASRVFFHQYPDIPEDLQISGSGLVGTGAH